MVWEGRGLWDWWEGWERWEGLRWMAGKMGFVLKLVVVEREDLRSLTIDVRSDDRKATRRFASGPAVWQ